MWRDDLQALEFVPAGRSGRCVVHRLALKRWVAEPGETGCQKFFAAERPAFEAAAAEKARRLALPADASFHLTSRDLGRALAAARAAAAR